MWRLNRARRVDAWLSVCPSCVVCLWLFLPLIPHHSPYRLPPFSHSILSVLYATPTPPSSFTGASSTVSASSCRGGIVSNRGLM